MDIVREGDADVLDGIYLTLCEYKLQRVACGQRNYLKLLLFCKDAHKRVKRD
jgi:hypothetical protein